MVVFPSLSAPGRPGPSVIRIGDDFMGVLMPVRASGGEERYQRPCWLDGELPLESWRVSLCGRLAWCHPRLMGWRLQRRFSLNLSSLCVT